MTIQILRDQRGWLCIQMCPAAGKHGLHAPTPVQASTRGTQILIQLESPARKGLSLPHLASWFPGVTPLMR